MFRVFSLLVVTALFSTQTVRAVEMNGTFDSTAPTGSNIANWDTGWGAAGVTGWDYVGTVNGASGVYLGNGWVLTAAHVGAGNFVLTSGADAGTYLYTGVSHSISNANGTADLTLFQIASAPSLPALSLATSAPSAFLPTSTGAQVAMLGFGGSHGETWGYNTVTLSNQLISVDGYPYVSNDFLTSDGSVSNGTASHTNDSQLVSGDSGGGEFIYNSALGEWQLAGINEATGTEFVEKLRGQWVLSGSAAAGAIDPQQIDFSAAVQLNTYNTQISTIIEAPEPPAWTLILPALGGVMLSRRALAASRTQPVRADRGSTIPSRPRSFPG